MEYAKHIKMHHNTRCIVTYFDVFSRIPMGSHHNTATIMAQCLNPPLRFVCTVTKFTLIKSIFFNLPSFTPPVRVTVGEVRYSIEIDVGGE